MRGEFIEDIQSEDTERASGRLGKEKNSEVWLVVWHFFF